MENNLKMKTALTIAGSDSSGGAGIQADLKTMCCLGVYGMSAITALTAQNTTGVADIFEVSPEFLQKQLDCVFSDIFPDAVKTGMLSDSKLIAVIADTLKKYKAKNIVVDPVMVSTSGCRLMQEDALQVFRTELMPLASLLTPNVPEAEILSGIKIETVDDMDRAANKICREAGCAVLVKGGHLDGNTKTDILYADGQRVETFEAQTVETRNTHGTGCTLSSAITAHLALGHTMADAIRLAKTYLYKALEAGKDVEIGRGHGPVNHFFNPHPYYTK